MRTVLGSILRAAGNSGNVCLGPSLRNHGLITGWRILLFFSKLTAGLGCDGDTIAMTGATQPSIEDVGALVIVQDREGRTVRLNRACEQMTGQSFEQARGQRVGDLFLVPDEKQQFQVLFSQNLPQPDLHRIRKPLGGEGRKPPHHRLDCGCASRHQTDAHVCDCLRN